MLYCGYMSKLINTVIFCAIVIIVYLAVLVPICNVTEPSHIDINSDATPVTDYNIVAFTGDQTIINLSDVPIGYVALAYFSEYEYTAWIKQSANTLLCAPSGDVEDCTGKIIKYSEGYIELEDSATYRVDEESNQQIYVYNPAGDKFIKCGAVSDAPICELTAGNICKSVIMGFDMDNGTIAYYTMENGVYSNSVFVNIDFGDVSGYVIQPAPEIINNNLYFAPTVLKFVADNVQCSAPAYYLTTCEKITEDIPGVDAPTGSLIKMIPLIVLCGVFVGVAAVAVRGRIE